MSLVYICEDDTISLVHRQTCQMDRIFFEYFVEASKNILPFLLLLSWDLSYK